MSKSTQALKDFLTVSPSVVLPAEVLELLQPVEDENARLREERDEFKALFELKDTQFNNVLSSVEMIKAENDKLRELFYKTYGYYVSGTLTPCDFCDKHDCEGDAPTTCKSDEYNPDGIVVEEIELLMRELRIEAEQ